MTTEEQGLRADERGASNIEYLVIVAIVALGGMGAWMAFGDAEVDTVLGLGDRIARMEGGLDLRIAPAALTGLAPQPRSQTPARLEVQGQGDTAPYVDWGGSFRIVVLDAGWRDGKRVPVPEGDPSAILEKERYLRGQEDPSQLQGYSHERAMATIDQVRADFERLAATETGARLITAIDEVADGRAIVLAFLAGPSDNASATYHDMEEAQRWADEGQPGFWPNEAYIDENGRAVVTEPGRRMAADKFRVVYNPRIDGNAANRYPDGSRCMPGYVALGHELVHLYHELTGTALFFEYDLEPGTESHEEAATIGMGPYGDDELTENALRRELGMRERTSHSSICP